MSLAEALVLMFVSSPSLGILALFVLLSVGIGTAVAIHDGIAWLVRRWRRA